MQNADCCIHSSTSMDDVTECDLTEGAIFTSGGMIRSMINCHYLLCFIKCSLLACHSVLFFGLFLMWVAQKISGIYTKHRRVIFKMFQFGFTLWINRRNKNLFWAARKRHWKSRLTAIRPEWHRVIQCSSFMHVTINIYYYFYSEEISLKCWAGLLTNLQFVKPGKQ